MTLHPTGASEKTPRAAQQLSRCGPSLISRNLQPVANRYPAHTARDRKLIRSRDIE